MGIMSSSVLQGVATVPVLLGKSSPRSPLPGGFALALGKSGGPPASLCFLSKLGWKCVSFRVSPQGTEQHPQRGDTETVTHHCVRCLQRPAHITVYFLVKGVAPVGPSGTHSVSLHPTQMAAQRTNPQGFLAATGWWSHPWCPQHLPSHLWSFVLGKPGANSGLISSLGV